MKLLEPETEIDGFVIGDCVHAGGMAHIYRVHYAYGAPNPGFPMVMKVPRMTAGDGAENIVSFEVEHQILQLLSGPHVPRFVAAGDLERLPYLVMEYVPGRTLQDWLDAPELPSVDEVVRLGAAMAHAAHSLHQQNVVHLDLKPANVLIRPDGSAVLLDFGLSCSGLYPDLLAEQLRKAVGSPAWIAPEQVVGVRGDPRSDIFAIGVILYQLLTGKLPFGAPQTAGGLRQRLWMDPPPLRQRRPELPPWLQEVVLRCLAPEAAQRYPSAAHLAFDLQHPQQVVVTARGEATQGTGGWTHFKRWLKAAGMHYQPSPLPVQQIEEVPIVMVAVPHQDVSDATLYSLRQATARSLGTRPGARLACVTVISPGQTSSTSDEDSETSVHRRYMAQLRQWLQPLDLAGHQVSCHVIESGDVAQALLSYAVGNRVSVIVIGAATHGLKTQRFLATVPIKVAMDAPCTVILVKQTLPFEQLKATEEPDGDWDVPF
jgi:nucleotide-binding universal stress UspA family protein